MTVNYSFFWSRGFSGLLRVGTERRHRSQRRRASSKTGRSGDHWSVSWSILWAESNGWPGSRPAQSDCGWRRCLAYGCVSVRVFVLPLAGLLSLLPSLSLAPHLFSNWAVTRRGPVRPVSPFHPLICLHWRVTLTCRHDGHRPRPREDWRWFGGAAVAAAAAAAADDVRRWLGGLVTGVAAATRRRS